MCESPHLRARIAPAISSLSSDDTDGEAITLSWLNICGNECPDQRSIASRNRWLGRSVVVRCAMSGSNERSSNTERQMERPPSRRRRMAGFLLVSFALGLSSQLQAEQNQLDWKSLIILCALVFGSFYGGLHCYIRGKNLKALSAQAVMAQDSRPPVLYLRSFRDDAAPSVSPIAVFFGMAATVFGKSTEEWRGPLHLALVPSQNETPEQHAPERG
jgi:hypothetical protein